MEIWELIFKLIACILTVLTCGKEVVNICDTQTFNVDEIQQCIWSEWKITEKYYGGAGWKECPDEDDSKNVYIQFFPDKIIYDGRVSEVSSYYNKFLAIKDEDALLYDMRFKDLGFCGDYFFYFEPSYADIKQKTCPFSSFYLLNDKELIILSGRVLYKAEKTGEIESSKPLGTSSFNSMCYGRWEITGNVINDENATSKDYIGETLTTSKELNSFTACRVFSVQNEEIYELVELMDIGENTYIGCFEFSEDYCWDEMIMKDGMTAILVKGNNLYWVERKSDPVEDGIYQNPF